MAFKLSYSSLRWPTPNLEEMLVTVKAAGWDGWELRPSLDWLGSAARVRRICEQAGLPVAAVTGTSISLDGHWAMRERNKRRIEFAAEVGADCFMFMGAARSRPTTDDDLRALAELADEFADYAAPLKLDVCYHIHNKTTVDSQAEWARLMELMEKCYLCLDVSHSAFWGYDPAESIRAYADRLIYVHLQDWRLDRFVELGQGGWLDFPAALQALDEIGFDRWVTVCPGETECAEEEKRRVNREYLRSLGY